MRQKRISLGGCSGYQGFQCRGGRNPIVRPESSDIVPTTKHQPDEALVEVLARVYRRQGLLDAGVHTSVRAIQRTAALWL